VGITAMGLALATGGYALAERLHVSAPLAVVVMGLVVGNHGARSAMSESTRQHLFRPTSQAATRSSSQPTRSFSSACLCRRPRWARC